MPQFTVVVTGPTYNPTAGWLLRIGEVERVQGAIVGPASSCDLRPQVHDTSGNVVTIKFYNTSGRAQSTTTVMTGTNFVAVGIGI